jgi:hypothetical protein
MSRTPEPGRGAPLTKIARGLVAIGLVCGVLYLFLWYVVGFAGPYPVEQFVEIGPSETAFVIPLEGEGPSAQTTNVSAEELKGMRISAKRVSLPLRKRKIGRLPGDFEWIPTVAVRKVNRAPVSREWILVPQAGTPGNDDALFCETKDGIKLYSGCAIAVRILEEDAYLYLYHFGERKLGDVIDTNVRGFAQMELAKRVKEKTLEQVQKNKAVDFHEVLELTKGTFMGKGITIDYLGNDGGYEYQNPRVQSSIDATVLADIQGQINEQEKLAADARNQIALEKADAENKAAEMQLLSKDALDLSLRIDYLTTMAEARRILANKFKQGGGKLPSVVLPSGGNDAKSMPQLILTVPQPPK